MRQACFAEQNIYQVPNGSLVTAITSGAPWASGMRKAAGSPRNPAAFVSGAARGYATGCSALIRAISAATSSWCSRYSACAFFGLHGPCMVQMNGTKTTTQPMQT